MKQNLKKVLLIIAIAIAILSLFGCATGGGLGGQTYYSPIEQECDGIARSKSPGMGQAAAISGLGGALAGAAGGAIIGAITGNPGKGAAIGGAAGGIGGVGYGAHTSNAQYQQIFNDCVRQKSAAYGQSQYSYQQPNYQQQGYPQQQGYYQQPQGYRRYP